MIRGAPFIWTPEQPIDSSRSFRTLLRDGPVRRDDGTNRYFLFRRRFELAERAEEASLRLFVDGRYQLFVNGAFIGRGPSRASSTFPRYDVRPIERWLQSGENVLGVLVHCYGVDTAWYERATDYWQSVFGDGGLWARLELRVAGEAVEIGSDETWRCQRAAAWRQDTPRIGWGLGFIEDFHAAEFPDGWSRTGFDDSQWECAQLQRAGGGEDDIAKGFAAFEPFPLLEPRTIPFMRERPTFPSRVLARYEIEPAPELPLDRRLYEETFHPLPPTTDDRCLLQDDDSETVLETGSHDSALLVQFERIHSGRPFIEFEARGGEVIEIALAERLPGEYLIDREPELRLRRPSYLDGAHVCRIVAKPGWQRFERFEASAIRYLQLVVRNAPGGVRVRRFGSVATEYPAEVAGRFRCSDPALSELWQRGAYTISQCSHDAWEDCPSREQRQWLGDGVVRYPAAAAAFGPGMQPLDRNFLLQAAESQRSDGLLQMFAPGDHAERSIIIPDYSLHWILILEAYVLYSGDRAILERLLPHVERVLSWFERHIDAHGLLAELPYWHFIEWAHVGRGGEACAVNALYVGAVRAAATLFGWAEIDTWERRLNAVAAERSDVLSRRHWSQARGLYVDEVDPETGQQGTRVSQQANALMLLYEIAAPEHRAEVVARISDDANLRLTAVPPVSEGDADFDADKHVVKANSFFAHFVYSALAQAGRFDLALASIKRSFAPMLETDCATLWESFEPTTSLCHAFSASPVHQLSAHALGIRPLAPGFERFLVAIQPAGLTHADGSHPTPAGNIGVRWEIRDGVLDVTVETPEGLRGRIETPPGFIAPAAPAELAPGISNRVFRRA